MTLEYCRAFFHMIMLNVPKLSRILERGTFYKRRLIKKRSRKRGTFIWFIYLIPLNCCWDNRNGLGQTTSVRCIFTCLGIWLFSGYFFVDVYNTDIYRICVSGSILWSVYYLIFVYTPFLKMVLATSLYMFTCSV